jgi:hypothetical protein
MACDQEVCLPACREWARWKKCLLLVPAPSCECIAKLAASVGTKVMFWIYHKMSRAFLISYLAMYMTYLYWSR